MSVFTPPTDDIVPPIDIVADPWYPTDPCMNKLMRHFRNQTRGRNIFLMSDGTVIDSQDTSYGAVSSGTPPNMIQPPTDPYARAVYESGGALVEEDFFQTPYVVRTLYGGSANEISTAEANQLTAYGYGAFIT